MPLTNGFREPLLQTLQNYGVHQQILRWLAHYLCSHTQSVCVNGSSSDTLPVSSRVLLATVLGPLLFHCCKSWSAQAWKLLGNVHMCPSLCASMYTAPMYKGWPSNSFSVPGVSKFVHMLCTNWTQAWAHVYISKQFPSLGTPTSTAVFIIYIDHIPDLQLSNSSMTSYADDIMLYHPIHTPVDYTCRTFYGRIMMKCALGP